MKGKFICQKKVDKQDLTSPSARGHFKNFVPLISRGGTSGLSKKNGVTADSAPAIWLDCQPRVEKLFQFMYLQNKIYKFNVF